MDLRTSIYPAMRRAYYMNDFGPLERAANEYPQLNAYLEFSREWTARGCRRPLKLFTKGVCEYNVKSPGISRIIPPDPSERRSSAGTACSKCWKGRGAAP